MENKYINLLEEIIKKINTVDKLKMYQLKYRKEHPEGFRKHSKNYYYKNKEKVFNNNKKYYELNKEKISKKKHERYIKKKLLMVPDENKRKVGRPKKQIVEDTSIIETN
jgi:hypothetical protein